MGHKATHLLLDRLAAVTVLFLIYFQRSEDAAAAAVTIFHDPHDHLEDVPVRKRGRRRWIAAEALFDDSPAYFARCSCVSYYFPHLYSLSAPGI